MWHEFGSPSQPRVPVDSDSALRSCETLPCLAYPHFLLAMLCLQLQRNANTCKTEPARNHIPGWRQSSSVCFFLSFFYSSVPLHICTLILVHFLFSPHLTTLSPQISLFLCCHGGWFGIGALESGRDLVWFFSLVRSGVLAISACLGENKVEAHLRLPWKSPGCGIGIRRTILPKFSICCVAFSLLPKRHCQSFGFLI
ncbi:hypothetical protein BDW67DRAFT_54785 [Aspergillus spinulosporus]